jgi:hypothetical protein
MNYKEEVGQIGEMMASIVLMASIRKEVASVMKTGFIVTDGKHHAEGSKYDIVVQCGSNRKEISRRIRGSIDNIKVEKIADDVLGVKLSRRGK